MEEETKKILIEKLGIKNYAMLKKSITRAENEEPKRIFHVTDEKITLKNKKLIEGLFSNLTVFNPVQWQKYVYTNLDKEGKAHARKRLAEQMRSDEQLNILNK